MNALKKTQRKHLNTLIERFETLKATLSETIEPITNDIGDAKSELTAHHEEVQEALDDLSDRARESERGLAIEEAAGDLAEADEKLEDVLRYCTEAVEEFDLAIESMRAALGEDQ